MIRRLRSQGLVGPGFESPVATVEFFGAVQAQDYPAAKWALGMRTRSTSEADVDRLFDEGRILRTHVMRPTWHLVLPEDIRWLLMLTGERLKRAVSSRRRELELDDRTLARALDVFAKALAGGLSMTRPELAVALRAGGIPADLQRLYHLLLAGEYAGLLVSGPRRGQEHTYALLEERAPRARELSREEALGSLARRYFRSHGPALVTDFAWWSGLTMGDARRAVDIAGPDVEPLPGAAEADWAGRAHLIPNFDELTVAYRDRSELGAPPGLQVLSNVLTIGGRVRGSWRRTLAPGRVRIEVSLRTPADGVEAAAIDEAAAGYGRFLGRTPTVRRQPE